MRPMLLLLPAALAAAPPPESAPAVPAAPAEQPSDHIRFADDAAGRMTVPVLVGVNGPYRFLIDTGAERTVISRQIAENLKLSAGNAAKIQTVIGSAQVATVHIPALQVSSRQVKVDSAPALETTHIGADGVLGIDTLESQRVVIDFKKAMMSVSPSTKKRERLDPDTIVVEARRRHGRLLFANAKIDGREVVVIVDTGSEMTVGNDALRARLLRGKPIGPTAELISVTGDRALAEIYNVRTIEIGSLKVGDVGIAFLRAPIFKQLDLDDRPALLLGMNILRAFDSVTIDFATRTVRFVLPHTAMAQNQPPASW